MTEEERLTKIKTIVEYSINVMPVVEMVELASQFLMAELWTKEDKYIDACHNDVTGTHNIQVH